MSEAAPPDNIGLCQDCANAKIIRSDRASIFYLCRLALTDPRFPKYPRLPVLTCSGFTAHPSATPPAH